jgi:hypothetical protein
MDNNSTAPTETIERRSSLKDTMKFGFKKDTKKKFGYRIFNIDISRLPKEINILNSLPPILVNEQIHNDCTANAVQKQITISSLLKNKLYVPSILYQYYNSRIINNEYGALTDEGCQLEDVYSALMTFKICDSNLFDYTHSVYESPSAQCYIEALTAGNVIESFEKIRSEPTTIKYMLAKNKPIVCGIPIYENFFNLQPPHFIYSYNDSSRYGNNSPRYGLLGLHAILIYGYNDHGFKVLNSHGIQFGDHGHFILSYDIEILDPYVIELI